jgi:serine/threonine-protein kinase
MKPGGIDPTLTADTLGPSAPTAPPLRATGYELGPVIGRGGMGEVVLARDPQLGRDVAIKRMLTADPSDDAVARFLREAKIQAILDHPAVVPVHELGADAEGRPYFTMKRLTGVTLAARLDDPASAVRPMLNAFVDVCFAIELAHTRGVIHRDLKPANIMLGDYREVYVLDWGVARVLGEAETARIASVAASQPSIVALGDATVEGSILGTAAYMAPEQERGEQVDATADVFALGCILFEILAREPLRPRTYRIGDPTGECSPARRTPDRAIAPELDDACVAALADDPAKRPTARELGERVQRYLDGDRDLEHRRALAAEHLARANEARAADDRASAMHSAGRALALDPESDAATLIGALLLEPPKDLPRELQDRLEEVDRGYARKQWRVGAWSYSAFFPFLLLLLWQGITNWPLVVALYIAVFVLTTHAFYASRVGKTSSWQALMTSGSAVMLGTSLFSPFVFVPSLLCVMCQSWFAYPGLMNAPKRLYAFLIFVAGLPIALELTGAIAPSWTVHNGEISITSRALSLGGPATTVLLIATTLVVITVAGFFGRSLAMSRREAQHQVEIQAWHLRKLVGR